MTIKAETLIYGEELLVILDESGEISFEQLEEKSNIKDKELKELIRYLESKNYLKYNLALLINDSGPISPSRVRLLPAGMEVVLGKRDYFNEVGIPQTIHNQTNVSNSSEFQIAQTSGDKSPITQTQDNSKLNILKQMITEDNELDDPKKEKLLEVLEKFNTIKESGENAFNLIKRVGSIATKYVPMFFGLIN